MKHMFRSQVLPDESINVEFGPYPKKPIYDIPLIKINSGASDVELEQNQEDKKVPMEVNLASFLTRSEQVGNQLGEEGEFNPDGTPIVVKIEQVTDDSDVAKDEATATQVDPPADKDRQPTPQTKYIGRAKRHCNHKRNV